MQVTLYMGIMVGVVKKLLHLSYFLNRPSFHLAFTEVQYFFYGSLLMFIEKPKILEPFAKHHDTYKKRE